MVSAILFLYFNILGRFHIFLSIHMLIQRAGAQDEKGEPILKDNIKCPLTARSVPLQFTITHHF